MMSPYILPGIPKTAAAYSIGQICDAVALAFQIPSELLKQPTRRRNISFPRQIAVHFAIKYSGKTTTEIGRYFGQDHSTIIFSNKKIIDYITTNQFIEQINKVETVLNNTLNSN